ncbi:MAG: T9SS type A sorting domain-containing protein [Bacteroidetes bacterium]|nr:T9SS type A sorting domain-containing protein [Bacteroidota bacterium]
MVQTIAQQCPLAGGPTVYTARIFLSMINDSIEYFDAAVCLQMGIFRIGKYNELLRTGISIVPNPAKNLVTIRALNSVSGLCKISIIDALGKLQLKRRIDCNQKVIRIDTKQLSTGVYTVAFKRWICFKSKQINY